jgi:hypothetical protein
VLDALARSQPGQEGRLLALPLLRDQYRDGLADRLVGGVAEDSLGPLVPARDDAFERLADDGVVGALDNRREPVRGDFGASQQGGASRGFVVGRRRLWRLQES